MSPVSQQTPSRLHSWPAVKAHIITEIIYPWMLQKIRIYIKAVPPYLEGIVGHQLQYSSLQCLNARVQLCHISNPLHQFPSRYSNTSAQCQVLKVETNYCNHDFVTVNNNHSAHRNVYSPHAAPQILPSVGDNCPAMVPPMPRTAEPSVNGKKRH